MQIISRVSGFFLVGLGLMIFTNYFAVFTGYINEPRSKMMS